MLTQTVEPAAIQDGAQDQKGSLKPVLDVIPPEAYDNPTWKGLAYFGRDLAVYAVLLVALVEISNPFAVLGLEVLMALAVGSLFIVGHDVAHGALFKSKRLSAVVGRVAMLPGWHVYEGWVLGHNRIHHAYTVREGFDFVWHPYTPEQYEAMGTLGKLRHRFEWSWIGAGAYYLREVWWHMMIVGKPPARWARAVRRDRIIVWSFVAVASLLLGALGWAMYGSVAGVAWMVVKV